MPKVEVYTTATCKYCPAVKSFLKENNIPFTEYDVSKDPEARNRLMNEVGERSVPVTVIDGVKVVGFKEHDLKLHLNIK